MPIGSWLEYYLDRGEKPRKEVIEALSYVKTGCALDLGSGAFVESKYLLEKGFSVIAVDPEISLNIFACEINSDDFTFECTSIQKFAFPTDFFDFVCANLSLPFVPKKEIKNVFQSTHTSMKFDGIFCFQLFGLKDERNKLGKRKSISFYSEDEITNLVRTFTIVKFNETEGLKKLVNGSFIHAHTFDVIVRK